MAKSKMSEAVMDRRAKEDRRNSKDRRHQEAPVATERRVSERRKVPRRRQIDPTTCERDYSGEEIEFMRAMDDYKRASGRMFPTCSEILEVIRALGYVRTPRAGLADNVSANPDSATDATLDTYSVLEVAANETEVDD